MGCHRVFPRMLMGGLAEGLACAEPGARTPIGVSGFFLLIDDSKCGATLLQNKIKSGNHIFLAFNEHFFIANILFE